jgi:hypothetical protein
MAAIEDRKNPRQEIKNPETEASVNCEEMDLQDPTMSPFNTSTATDAISEDEALPTIGRPSCAISELQSAFGTLLVADKNVDPVTLWTKPNFQRWGDILKPKPKPPIMPKWTGSFALFSFPRELRDKIYYHYLYRPDSILYQRNPTRADVFDDRPEEITSLFLTSRQVYSEAWDVFCRYNRIEIPARQDWYHQRRNFKTLDGTLRLFPDKPARTLQHISISFQQYLYMYQYRSPDDTLTPSAAFVQMLRDAYTIKSTFPRLREFSVHFHDYHDFFDAESTLFEIEGADDEEKIERSKRIMENWMQGSNVVPPSWLYFDFDKNWCYEGLRKQRGVWNEAYQRLVKERKVEGEGLESSGREWIEEWARGGRREGRKWRYPRGNLRDE